ncbi:MAG: hypothetical protein LBN95_12100 [Prevotellaceae bacterium]|jgi:hypothetical protein|nr:hypothetical protein [Prevotellaceae bacterium]
MKKSFVLCAAFLALSLVSCDKKDAILTDENSVVQRAPIKGGDVMLDSIAKIICNISDNNILMNEVLKGIDDNLYFGFDEELRLIDVLFPDESKIIRNKLSIATLTEVLRTAFGVIPNSTVKSNLNNKMIEYIVEYDTHIYFPYSEDWNRVTQLEVTSFSDEDNLKGLFAYKKKNGEIQPFKLDLTDDYMVDHPILVISQNTTPYDALPNFIGGIYEKDGVIFATRFEHNFVIFDDDVTPKPYCSPDSIYALYVGNVKCTERFDVGHGPELRFKFVTARINNSDTIRETYTVASYNFTKKEVKNGTINTTSTKLVGDWKVESVFGGYEIYEEDPGYKTQVDIPIELSISTYVTFKTTIPIGKHDDEIYQTGLGRVEYFSTHHMDQFNGFRGGWPVRGGGGSVTYTFMHTSAARAY